MPWNLTLANAAVMLHEPLAVTPVLAYTAGVWWALLMRVLSVLLLVLQALGLEVRSVLAIGGIGGLAIGLAGREICENLLNGFLLMTTVRKAGRA